MKYYYSLISLLLCLFVGHVTAQTEKNLVINEIMAANVDEYLSPSTNFDGWIELYNPTSQVITLGGLYFSDDAAEPKKWLVPEAVGDVEAHGYKVIWFDHSAIAGTNCSWDLDADGGAIYINDANGQNLVQVTYPAAKPRIAYARTTDGGDTWGLTANPTPGKSNASSVFATSQLSAPKVSPMSQLFTGSLKVSITIPTGATLRYTTDGTLPTLTNGKTLGSGSLTLSKTSTLRFRLFQDGKLPSDVTSRSYIINDKNYTLPIVSIVTDPRFLYNDTIGITMDGVGLGNYTRWYDGRKNWIMDWERPGDFSYATSSSTPAVYEKKVGIEMAGAYSRSLTPKPFRLKGRKKYDGSKNMDYPFFAAKPYIRNRAFMLRNGGNDIDCRIKDPIIASIVQTAGIKLDIQSYQPVHEFVNGDYKGVLNMREVSNKRFAYSNYGYDEDLLDMFEVGIDSGYVQKVGDAQALDRLLTLSKSPANANNYAEIKQLLDIDEFINYMGVSLYTGRTDWPHNNMKGFRQHNGGKFHLILNDMDVAFATHDPFGLITNERTYYFSFDKPPYFGESQEIKFISIFINMLRNSEFRRRYIDNYCIQGGSVFEPTRASAVIDSLTARVEPAMNLEGRSCMSSANDFRSKINGWLDEQIEAIQNYSNMRLTSTTPQAAKLSSNIPYARLLINDQEIPTGKFDGKLFAPVTLKAEPMGGYTFKGWSLSGGSTTDFFARGSSWNYYDQGTLSDDDWRSSLNASLSGWKNGKAPLGYNKSGLNTTLSYGGDSSNKYPIYYFRRNFNLDEAPKEGERFFIDFTIDDGLILYINGKEATRYNMAAGSPVYAITNVPGNPDVATVELPASLFHAGTNYICAEVHNCSASSSDIYWDARVYKQGIPDDADLYSTENEISMPEGDFELQAIYEPTDDATRQAEGINPVRINEISGSNETFQNEFFKRADWVELYNTTSQDIDLRGMYLTDDSTKLHKYAITAGENVSTIIPAHGYRIIWCDKKAGDTQLHASFKVDGDGGLLILTAADDSWSDRIDYSAHDFEHTVGRYPDGANTVYMLSRPTIDAANTMDFYTEYVYTTTPTGITNVNVDQPADFTVNYAAQRVIVRGERSQRAHVELFNLNGQKVASLNLPMSFGYGESQAIDLPKGVYVARAVDDRGQKASCKFGK